MLLLFVAMVGAAIVGLFVWRSDRDAVAVLTIYLVALFAINARWVIPGAGAVGTPAMVIAGAVAWWWWMARLNPDLTSDPDPNPVRVALLCYLWFVALSWGLSRLRSLSELEVNGSNRAILTVIGLTGVALLICDAVDTRQRLETLLKRVVMGGALVSTVGLLQFFTEIDLVAIIRFPGLVLNSETTQALAIRGDFSRAEGTTLHSIEFSVVLAMILPLAVYFAMTATSVRERRRYAVITAIVATGIPLSVTRTGVVALAAALLLTAIAWSWRQRIIGFVMTCFATVVLGVAIPGLIGTFRWLIFGSSNDPSVTARIDRVPLFLEEFSMSPWLGSGIGTFSADEDFLLDNQYFATLIETGITGLLVVLMLISVAITMCVITFRHTRDSATRQLSMALAASIAVLPVVMATFDAFFYQIFMGGIFVILGSTGALWRIAVRDDLDRQVIVMRGSIA